ncbi:MAG: glycosyltransferase family 4 protein [Minisyncoccales bacterium]
MKIAFLNKYQNKVARGAETFVFELSQRLSKNHDVDVIADINYLNLFTKKYDLIIPTNGRCQVVLIRIITWLTGSKMIVSGQSGMGWDDRINLYSFPDAFVALSSEALKWANRVNPGVKSLYIPNGVDLNKFKAESRRLKDKTKVVLAVGAFTEQKRLDLAIDAVSELNDINLTIAGGGGGLKDEIYDLGIRRLGKRFRVISVPFEKMPEVYGGADVFTLPSHSSESFGNVLVEAMASGLPVVATDDPIRREIVGDAGFFVDPTDMVAYAKALRLALDKNWGDTPSMQAEKFSWDKIAKDYEELLEKLIE